jgi:hypothetical protein
LIVKVFTLQIGTRTRRVYDCAYCRENEGKCRQGSPPDFTFAGQVGRSVMYFQDNTINNNPNYTGSV